MNAKVQLTKEGLKKIEEEYRDLIDNQREVNKKQLSEARAQGDLSENADYDAARNRQAEIEGRIKELEAILDNYEIISEKKDTKKIALGSTVTIFNRLIKKEQTFSIVGTIESDAANGKISNNCPLGIALIGKEVGDVVEIKAVKVYEVEVLKIETK